jgi:voltage-dependent calcium channel alpha-2/delta-3
MSNKKCVLLQSLEKDMGARCNRAIMIITDGMPDIYKDIFDEYNWRTGMHVRIFTFRIGDEETGIREMQWIACNNNGEKQCQPLLSYLPK